MRIAVVMAGGVGERFWPLSRLGRPKQLLRLTHPTMTMIEEAIDRISKKILRQHTYISTSVTLLDALRESAAVLDENVLAEPARRNTLGALVWVVASLMARGHADATVAVLTSDHMIGEPEKFVGTIEAAFETAERESALVTIGVCPTRAETGYGYIEVDRSQAFAAGNDFLSFRATRFREKPSKETAEEFLRAGTFLWNSGMFFFTIPTFLSELERAQSEPAKLLYRVADALRNLDDRSAALAFEELPNVSIDYALMEKAERVFVVPGDFPWDDVGAWDALARSFPLDESGNAVQGRTVLIETEDSVVINEDPDAMVATLGMKGVVVVNTRDAVLVCAMDRAQEVRKIATEAGHFGTNSSS